MVEHGNAAGIRELGIEVLEFRHFKQKSAQYIGFVLSVIPFLLQRFQLIFQLFIMVGEFIVAPVVLFLILRMDGIILDGFLNQSGDNFHLVSSLRNLCVYLGTVLQVVFYITDIIQKRFPVFVQNTECFKESVFKPFFRHMRGTTFFFVFKLGIALPDDFPIRIVGMPDL